jgi:hypothetical protein
MAHQLTTEDRIKGSQTMSYYKSLARTLAARKKCTTSCVFFEKCPANAVSMGFRDEKNPENDRKCLMKEFPHTVRQQFIDLFLTGEEGVIASIKKALHNYMNDVDAYGTLKDKRDMVQLMLQFYDKVYNNPKKGAQKKEPLTITIKRVGMSPEVIDVTPHEVLPAGTTIVRAHNDPAADDITEGDPESLINSPILTEVMRPVSRPINMVMEEIKIESNIEQLMEEDDGLHT